MGLTEGIVNRLVEAPLDKSQSIDTKGGALKAIEDIESHVRMLNQNLEWMKHDLEKGHVNGMSALTGLKQARAYVEQATLAVHKAGS